jgi:PAS domain S-box-containing protein
MNSSLVDAYNSLPFGIYLINMSQKIIFWNKQMEKYTGYNSSEMIGQNSDILNYFEDEKQCNQLNFALCMIKEGELQRQTFIKTKNNNLKALHTSLNRIEVDGDQLYLIASTDLDTIINCDYYLSRTSVSQNKLFSFNGIIGDHPKMKEMYRLIQLSAESDANIIISGESGTGKELIASAIHQLSTRKNNPFIKINCAALSESLLESELFGHSKGAFTGAISDKIGKFEAANNGTLFLDEIGEISPLIQVKLLRVIQERVVERVGETKSREINIRLITATNKDLLKMIGEGLFREDLYYRLKVFPIQTMPLKDRITDISYLINHFIEKQNKKTGKQIDSVSDEVLSSMMKYHWPGNVRELENAIEYAFVLSNSNRIQKHDLPFEITNSVPHAIKLKKEIKSTRNSVDKDELIDILNAHDGSRKLAAEYLNISTVALWKKMKKFEII